MERYIIDVDNFPLVSDEEKQLYEEWANADDDDDDDEPLDFAVDENLSEQFHAALVRLTTRCGQLKPLPSKCAFNIALELKDDSHVPPPVSHPKSWIPVQPSPQETDIKNSEVPKEGEHPSQVRITPVRTVASGEFQFETWIEESKAKFNLAGKPIDSTKSNTK